MKDDSGRNGEKQEIRQQLNLRWLETGKDIFDKKSDKTTLKTTAGVERQQSKLYETIDQLTVERAFLKKAGTKLKPSKLLK